MKLQKVKHTISAMLIGLLTTVTAMAGANEEAVAQQVDLFRKAQLAANGEALMALTATELSYSHSDGRVEDKPTFVANATSGKSPFISLEYRDPSIRVTNNAAVVRFHWVGEQVAAATGIKTGTNLHILMVWQKQGDEWKLLARSATKL